MLTHYKLRITLTECDIKDVILYLSKYKQYAYCFETGKKEEHPHYHIYLISDIKEDTMRTQLRKLSKSAKGNKLYSLKQLNLDEGEYAIEYLAYMMKEGDFKNENIPESTIIEAKAYDDKVKVELKEKKEKKKNRYTKIVLEYAGVKGEGCFDDVFNHVVKVLEEEKTNISQSTITSWCNTLLLKTDPLYKHQLSCKVYGNLFPQSKY